MRRQVSLPSGRDRGAKPRNDGDESEDAATRPGAPARQSAPLSTSAFGRLPSSDFDEDPATVKADRRAITRALENLDSDPATVQRFVSGRPGTPMSFRSESVSDPETVFDDGGDPARWRDDIDPDPHGHDELPPGPLPSALSGPAWAERSGPTLSREIPPSGWGTIPRRAEELPLEPTGSRVTVWVPILVGAAGGFLCLLLIVAWFLGSP